jgi:glycosyltransferase involved in cell wall biosynthesis
MKVLYLGHYKEQSGWSHAAINNILALDSVGVDVVCRNIPLTHKNGILPDRIYDLESKSTDGSDYCIQHILPHHLAGTSLFKKNVAYCPAESIHTQKNVWHENMSVVDEVWVANNSQKNNMQQFITKKVEVVPHTFDCSLYEREYTDNFKGNNCFRFYNISDINGRKNLTSIIRCFYHCFDFDDSVELVIKAKKHGMHPQEINAGMENLLKEIREQMRKHVNQNHYAKVRLICEDITNDEILDLHTSCDCYIGISRGEAWSIPAFEAMAFGNTPICSNEGGPLDFIDDKDKNTGTLINGVYDICNQKDSAFEHIFTGREMWFHASEQETCNAMKYYYNNQDKRVSTNGLEQAKKFDYNIVGNIIKEKLYA